MDVTFNEPKLSQLFQIPIEILHEAILAFQQKFMTPATEAQTVALSPEVMVQTETVEKESYFQSNLEDTITYGLEFLSDQGIVSDGNPTKKDLKAWCDIFRPVLSFTSKSEAKKNRKKR